MSKYYISAYGTYASRDNDYRLTHFEVPEEIYIYIKQLEGYIKHPETSNLKQIYWERF